MTNEEPEDLHAEFLRKNAAWERMDAAYETSKAEGVAGLLRDKFPNATANELRGGLGSHLADDSLDAAEVRAYHIAISAAQMREGAQAATEAQKKQREDNKIARTNNLRMPPA